MRSTFSTLIVAGAFAATASAAPTVQIRLPERFRTLTGQLFDFRVEATKLTDVNSARIRVLYDGREVTPGLPSPEVTSDNDNNASDLDKAWTFRGVSIPEAGSHTIVAEVTDNGGTSSATQRIGTQDFSFQETNGSKKNIILYIGDAMS